MTTDAAVAMIRAAGMYSVGFAVFHLFFWRLFDWKQELERLSFLNRAIMQVLNLCVATALAIFGSVSLFFASELTTPGLGRTLLALMAFFWLARAAEQMVFFKLRHWGSWALLVVFVAGAALYALPAALAT